MNKDYVHNLFKSLEGNFDDHETPEGHQKRFLERLNAQAQKPEKTKGWWKPLSIAASIVVLFGLGFTFLNQPAPIGDLASVSPEMAETQTFFTTTINKELATLKSQTTPETKALVDDAMRQMEVLEQEYEKLKMDLLKSGNNKRVIYAMITNFQNRIELLEQVLVTIEEVKNLNNTKDEITI
ncbi:hypothetical protein ATE92_2474 [Ulvibacter sp. MAR_2010_11]|uniref:hypothetical protein n=1 Tax=Ulvibacter sp. MAR_2010_11 TaxID=1250229 RepID=UPI000C2BB7D2|nr:hypothetical protein [Ulvibacter sp. MAR_2010_11]PKA84293.1 hypothetical protein ATE92_2474 [Ulvibacter sp. MAR_2010_11]